MQTIKYVQKKYIKEETQLLTEMFVENGRKITFLENLVKYYHNAKKKKMTVAITPTHRKSRGYLILEQKLGKNSQSTKRHYKTSFVKINQIHYLIVILEYTSWIVYAMVDLMVNQRRKY